MTRFLVKFWWWYICENNGKRASNYMHICIICISHQKTNLTRENLPWRCMTNPVDHEILLYHLGSMYQQKPSSVTFSMCRTLINVLPLLYFLSINVFKYTLEWFVSSKRVWISSVSTMVEHFSHVIFIFRLIYSDLTQDTVNGWSCHSNPKNTNNKSYRI